MPESKNTRPSSGRAVVPKKPTKPAAKRKPAYDSSPRLEQLFAESMKLQSEIIKEIRLIKRKKATNA